MIVTKNVSKRFGHVEVLKDISFEIKHGEIVGFLGQNGAGKTTLMRILTSFLTPSSGTVLIGGESIKEQSLNIRRKIGYLPETPPLYESMTVFDYLKYAALLKEVKRSLIKSRIESVLNQCFLEDVAQKAIVQLSKGYKQRVGIAQAIIHDPEILILDEPTSGLDPIQNLQVRQLIQSLEKKRTVLLSTHILSEIEHIANRVLIIKSGEIIVDQPLNDLLQKSGEDKISLEQKFLELHSK